MEKSKGAHIFLEKLKSFWSEVGIKIMQTKLLTFRISRFIPGIIEPSRFQDFQIHIQEHMNVLDGVELIRLEQDPALMYRHSCHHSCCGTCACKINGQERLMCLTNVFALQTDVITLEPLDGFPREADLVVTMTPFYRFIADDWKYLRQSEHVQSQAMPDGVERFTRLENCIECGACVSACPVMHRSDTPFMGPAAMAAVSNELAQTPERRAELLALAGCEHGERWCERALDCVKVCPAEVYPARHIADLRRMLGKP